jgi:hypothetical protein
MECAVNMQIWKKCQQTNQHMHVHVLLDILGTIVLKWHDVQVIVLGMACVKVIINVHVTMDGL